MFHALSFPPTPAAIIAATTASSGMLYAGHPSRLLYARYILCLVTCAPSVVLQSPFVKKKKTRSC